jgi:hypothetical protein
MDLSHYGWWPTDNWKEAANRVHVGEEKKELMFSRGARHPGRDMDQDAKLEVFQSQVGNVPYGPP